MKESSLIRQWVRSMKHHFIPCNQAYIARIHDVFCHLDCCRNRTYRHFTGLARIFRGLTRVAKAFAALCHVEIRAVKAPTFNVFHQKMLS
jgi:hypothetical protein